MMPMHSVASHTVVLPRENIDTDQIIPARFLKVTDKKGLGKALFADWRYDTDGRERGDFVLNQPCAEGARILVAGDNFGCGSSREHAPWALFDWGIRAVVSTSIADIFRNNALKNGLIPVVVDADVHQRLLAAPGIEVRIDIAERRLTLSDEMSVSFPLDGFARHCLLEGVDELGFLLTHADEVTAFEANQRSR